MADRSDHMWTCDLRSSVEWFQRSYDHLRSSAITCKPGLSVTAKTKLKKRQSELTAKSKVLSTAMNVHLDTGQYSTRCGWEEPKCCASLYKNCSKKWILKARRYERAIALEGGFITTLVQIMRGIVMASINWNLLVSQSMGASTAGVGRSCGYMWRDPATSRTMWQPLSSCCWGVWRVSSWSGHRSGHWEIKWWKETRSLRTIIC